MEPESELLFEWHDTGLPCMDELIELSRCNAIPANLILDRDSLDSVVPIQADSAPEGLDRLTVIAEFGEVAVTNLTTFPRLRTLDVANLTPGILQ